MHFEIQGIGSIFTVNTTDDLDDGTCDATHCSLREAILADERPSRLGHLFRHPRHPALPHRAAISLPPNWNPVAILGGTQPGFAGQPLIELHGGSLLDSWGFWLDGDNSLLSSVIINGFQSGPNGPAAHAVWVEGTTTTIESCWIGSSADGLGVVTNTDGIYYVSGANVGRIGGQAPGSGNLVVGHTRIGIFSWGDENWILGNIVGLDRNGNTALGNTYGLQVAGLGVRVGGAITGWGNLISGNQVTGLSMAGETSFVQGNLIGTDATGELARPNLYWGIQLGRHQCAGRRHHRHRFQPDQRQYQRHVGDRNRGPGRKEPLRPEPCRQSPGQYRRRHPALRRPQPDRLLHPRRRQPDHRQRQRHRVPLPGPRQPHFRQLDLRQQRRQHRLPHAAAGPHRRQLERGERHGDRRHLRWQPEPGLPPRVLPHRILRRRRRAARPLCPRHPDDRDRPRRQRHLHLPDRHPGAAGPGGHRQRQSAADRPIPGDPLEPTGFSACETVVDAANGPHPGLRIPGHILGAAGGNVVAPVYFTAWGHAIAAVSFAVDLGNCVSFDPVDADFDNLPDNVALHLPAGWSATVTYNPGDSDGELKFVLFDVPPFIPLATSTIAEFNLGITCPAPPILQVEPLRFESLPAIRN